MTPPFWWPRCATCGRWLSWNEWEVNLNDYRDFCEKHQPDRHRRESAFATNYTDGPA